MTGTGTGTGTVRVPDPAPRGPGGAYGRAVLTSRRPAEDVVRRLTSELAGLLEGVFADLEPVRAEAAHALADQRRRSALGGVGPLAATLLRRPDGLVGGAGYVAEPGFLADAERWLEWWTVADGHVRRLEARVEEPGATLDYSRQPWLVTPRQTRRRLVTGPYVDYVCSDEYTLTLSTPVEVDGAFAGIVGADVAVRSLEPHLEDLLSLPRPAALVNAQGRVVAGTGTPASGELLRAASVPTLWAAGIAEATLGGVTLHRLPGDLPLGLVLLP